MSVSEHISLSQRQYEVLMFKTRRGADVRLLEKNTGRRNGKGHLLLGFIYAHNLNEATTKLQGVVKELSELLRVHSHDTY